MPASSLPETRVAVLEKDSATVHQALLEQSTRIDVLEATVEAGFASLEHRFDALQAWLAERL